jgi:hypothetical protein
MRDLTQDLSNLDRTALLAELKKTRDGLEDAEEMRRFTLRQTGAHIGARQLKAMQTTWVRDEEHQRQRLMTIEALLVKLPAACEIP